MYTWFSNAETRDRTGDLQIFSLTLSQLSYRGLREAAHRHCIHTRRCRDNHRITPMVDATTAREEARNMHQPGIEPRSHRWQRCILPLDH